MSVLDNYSCEGQLSIEDVFGQDIWSGKTFPEPSAQTAERTSRPSSRKRQKSQTKMPLFLDLRGGAGHLADVSWETDGLSLGEYMMHNISEFHSGASAYVYLLISTGTAPEGFYLNCGETPMEFIESKLSWVLETNPDPKYNLSQKACLGILRRAENRGKVLPEQLDQALRAQAGLLVSKNEPENQGGGKGILIQDEHTGALSTLNTIEKHAVCVENHPNDSRCDIREDGVVQTLSGRMGTGGNNVPMVMSEVADGLCAQDGRGGVHTQRLAHPEGNFVLEPVCVGNGQVAQTRMSETVGTLNCMHDQRAVMTYGLDRASFNQGANAQYNFSIDEEKVGALTARGPAGFLPCKSVDCLNGRGKSVNGTLAANARKSLNSGNVVRIASVVRRLTPMECERLQGYPDHWTDIGEWVDTKGKKHKDADSPRYKALGNSIALPFWRWLAERIAGQYPDNNKTTMASLFDGIGGFGLVFSQVGIEPVWASEIEEFPMAVTRLRFPE